jgi:putative DNA primase/helicase
MLKKKVSKFAQTDVGNAEMFASASSDDLRYDHQRGRWLAWRKHWWSSDNVGSVYQRAKSVARMRAQLASNISDEKKQTAEFAWAFRSEARARIEAMLRLAEAEYPLFDSGEGWDANPMLLGVANGVIDLRTGILRDGLQADKITLHSDITFDPSAQCPRWLQFLGEVFGNDQQLIEYVQRAIGYSLTGDTREQCLFFCYGSGANGKSTLLEILRRIIGSYAHTLPFSAFELTSRTSIPNDLASMAGKRFVTALETNEAAQLNEARIKMLTGCDPVSARLLYHEHFTFVTSAKIWLAFNHQPEVHDDSHGFWRRLKLIPFHQRFEGSAIDKDLLAKLLVEAPGILAWAVQGALKWLREGLGEPPAAVREATNGYRDDSDPIGEFIAECCVVSPGAIATAGGIWELYQEWEKRNGISFPLSRKAFSHRLEAKGFKKGKCGHERTRIWLGISLRNVQEYFSRDAA